MSRKTVIHCDICKHEIKPDRAIVIEVPSGDTLPTLRRNDTPELDLVRVDCCQRCISDKIFSFLRGAVITSSDIEYLQVVQSLLGDNIAELVMES